MMPGQLQEQQEPLAAVHACDTAAVDGMKEHQALMEQQRAALLLLLPGLTTGGCSSACWLGMQEFSVLVFLLCRCFGYMPHLL